MNDSLRALRQHVFDLRDLLRVVVVGSERDDVEAELVRARFEVAHVLLVALLLQRREQERDVGASLLLARGERERCDENDCEFHERLPFEI